MAKCFSFVSVFPYYLSHRFLSSSFPVQYFQRKILIGQGTICIETGPVDGVGGTVKRAVWRRVLQNRVTVTTAKEFASVATDACPNINILCVEAAQVNGIKSL